MNWRGPHPMVSLAFILFWVLAAWDGFGPIRKADYQWRDISGRYGQRFQPYSQRYAR